MLAHERPINLWPGLPSPLKPRGLPGSIMVEAEARGRGRRIVAKCFVDKKRVRKRFDATAAGHADAVLWLRERTNSWGDPSERDLTVRGWFARWLDEVKATQRPKTYHAYESLARHHLMPALATMSPAMAHQSRSVLSAALAVAVRRGLIDRNPLADRAINLPPVHRKTPEPWSMDETDAFLDSLADDQWGAMFTVALWCGLREGELLGLMWGDIIFERRALRVRRSLTLGKLADTKTRNGVRTVPLFPPVEAALRRLRETWRPGRGEFRDLVFLQQYGPASRNREALRAWHQAGERAGLRKIRLHDARRLAITRWALNGVPVAAAMRWAGHSNVTMTLGLYASVGVDDSMREAERMWAAVSATPLLTAPGA